MSLSSTWRRVRSSCTRRLITLHSGMALTSSRCVRAMVSAHSAGSIFWMRTSSTHSSTDTSKALSASDTPSARQSSGFMEFALKKGNGVHKQWLMITSTSWALWMYGRADTLDGAAKVSRSSAASDGTVRMSWRSQKWTREGNAVDRKARLGLTRRQYATPIFGLASENLQHRQFIHQLTERSVRLHCYRQPLREDTNINQHIHENRAKLCGEVDLHPFRPGTPRRIERSHGRSKGSKQGPHILL